jgi:hypothetical protein
VKKGVAKSVSELGRKSADLPTLLFGRGPGGGGAAKLQVLDLSDNNLYTVGYMSLIRALQNLQSLRRLVLHNTAFEDEVLPFLALALGLTRVLEVLDLTGNYITADKVELLRARGAPAALGVNFTCTLYRVHDESQLKKINYR